MRAGDIESQRDGDVNILDFGTKMASSVNGAMMLASGPVANGESRNQETVKESTRSTAVTQTMNCFATLSSCLVTIGFRALEQKIVICGVASTIMRA